MKYSLLAALSLFEFLTVAMNPGSPGCPFKLNPAADGPAEIAGLGGVTWDHVVTGSLGWLHPNSEVVRLSMDSGNGPAVYSSYDPLNLYLRPTHGTPQYFAKLGHPSDDLTPALTLWKNFTITRSPQGYDLFGYNGFTDGWVACGNSSGYTLYFNSGPSAKIDCTANFGLEVKYLEKGHGSDQD